MHSGARAEDAAAQALLDAGLELVARNVRVGRLEIDLVFRDGPVIIVVEVRTRGPGAWQRALDSIDPKKQARVRTAGERLWRARFANDPSAERICGCGSAPARETMSRPTTIVRASVKPRVAIFHTFIGQLLAYCLATREPMGVPFP